MLYHIIDGAYLGFYREYGGTVFISGYRTIVKKQWIVKERLEEVWIEGEEARTRIWIEGHYEDRRYWVPEHTETRTETVPGEWVTGQIWIAAHYELRRYWVDEVCWYESKTIERPILGVMVPVTRMVEVCEPAHFATRQVWVAGDWKQTKDWVSEHEEKYEETISGHYEVRREWQPLREIEITTKRPGRWEFKLLESGKWEDVEVEDPIYSYYGLRDEYCLVERKRAPLITIAGEHEGDLLRCRITGTDQWVPFNADFLCCATSIGENQYVCPG